MPEITILPETVINKIAAGEVVESPFSVIKELIENSIDANASKIFINIKNGGRDLISVLDNGKGMSEADCHLAIQRHATSKIKKEQDLFAIQTMGFRGEALAAIASVSRFEITTSQSEEHAGINLYFEGGKKVTERKVGFSIGTRIVVKDLFQNTPARLKFLKPIKSEVSKIYEGVICLALANLQTEFKLISDQKTLIHLPIRQNLLQRMVDCFGKRAVENLVCIKYKEAYLDFYAWLSLPNFCRVNKKMQFTYVNSRYVKSRQINNAIYAGYEALLPKHLHPFYLIKVNLAPNELDVNVHPAKIEIKLKNATLVQTILSEQIKQQLRSQGREKYKVTIPKTTVAKPTNFSNIPKSVNYSSMGIDPNQTVLAELPPANYSNPTKPKEHNFTQNNTAANKPTEPTMNKEINIQVLGIFKKYLFAIVEESFAIVDVHAAHERIRFEQLKLQYQNSRQNKIESYLLLDNLLLSFSPQEAKIIQSYEKLWSSLGFEITDFGNMDFSIKAIPAILRDDKKQVEVVQGFILETIKDLTNFGKTTDFSEFIITALQKMACHSSIRGQSGVSAMSNPEMEQLIKQIYTLNLDLFCPHGRPIIIFKEEKDFDKTFHRS